jgi:hypothetical protein
VTVIYIMNVVNCRLCSVRSFGSNISLNGPREVITCTLSRPPLVDPLQDELRLLNRSVREVLPRQIRLVRLDRLDQLPRAQERGGKEN